MPRSIKVRIGRQLDEWAADHERTIAEFPDTHEPTWWEARGARLWRETIVPRLEALEATGALTPVQADLLARGRAFLAANGEP